jgi:release factor glutamine methyltransferase
LAPGGRLLVETGARQASGTVEAFARGGLRAEVVSDEDLSATVVVGSVGL